MKKNNLKLLIFSLLLIVGQQLLAQGPPPPPGNPSTGNETVGGAAPISGGIGILMLLGFAYGTKKTYKIWKSKEELED